MTSTLRKLDPADPRFNTQKLSVAIRRIRNMDLLLFDDPDQPESIAGRGRYYHVGTALWWPTAFEPDTRFAVPAAGWDGAELMCAETRAWYGSRAVPLADLVARYPGKINVFTVNPHGFAYDREAAARYLIKRLGKPYGWEALLRAYRLYAPGVRYFVRPSTDDRADHPYSPFCSTFRVLADRAGGHYPFSERDPWEVLPSEFANQPDFYQYMTTLLPG